MSAFLAAVGRRLRMAWGIATGQVLAPLVAVAALGLVGFGFVAPVWWAEPLAVGVGVSAGVAVLVWALLLRVPEPVAARAADRGLQTKDAFATALELRAAPAEGLHPYVLRRAEGLASGTAASEAVPIRWHRRRIGAAALVAASALGLGFAPNHQDEVRAERAAEDAAIEAVADDLREQAAELAEDPSATEAQQAEAEALERLAEELDRADSIEEAEQALAEARAEQAAEVSAALEAQRAAAVGLERSVAAEPLPGAAADAPASEQFQQAADALDGLSAEEQAALAAQLAELAQGQAAANPALAEALAAAADALESGDVAGARAALGEAAAAQDAASESVEAQDAAADGAARVGDAQRQLGEGAPGEGRGRASGDGSGGGQGDNDGDGDGSGNGNGQGQGQGSGSGSGSGAGGSPSGNVGGSSASNGSGQGGVGRPNGSGNNPSTGLDTSGEETSVYDPGDVLDAGGANTGSDPGQTTGRGNGASGRGASFVPLADVIAEYRDRAGRAVERADIPPSQRDLVRAYFDNLANGGPR